MGERRRFVVAYDIREDRRLRQVHEVCQAFGYPLQYSVFICDLDRGEHLSMKARLGEVIHHRVDDIVFIDVGEARGRGEECFDFMGARSRDLPSSGPTIL